MEAYEKATAYKVFRTILGPIYKFWYNPKIIGKENIPKEGRFIIVGNHIHIMDQCNVIAATKRVIHYMAKKEYFDPQYKEGHHGWFFRSAGCIPVDRTIKDEEATHAALEVLQHDHALGLFPEGTRNGLKEARARELYDEYLTEENISFEDFYQKAKKNRTSFVNYLEELMKQEFITKDEWIDNIATAEEYVEMLLKERRITKEEYYDHIFLPFKFGAVSMSKKTGSPIIPFVITGDYKFRSKNLTIRIGKPLDPEEDLEKANHVLEETMREMVKENDRMNGK
ncbi:MAG: 1-acyl-sn-glycerol-3-phosphate acyltransferase [Bacilli bacterium]|nr:1-acyl-sn-glycerol-3-phosphate acyltransferase [Bacilli bacterium]